MSPDRAAFQLHSVVHLIRPAGFHAAHLEGLREGIERASVSSLFLHAIQPTLRHPAAELLPPDDFSGWVNGVVQDRETAERMSFAVQNHATTPAELRDALLELLGAIPRETRLKRDAPADGAFVFLEVEPVPVPTGALVLDADALMEQLANADASVWFYHLIECPWLEPHAPALVDWIRATGDLKLADWLAEVAQSGRPLEDIRQRMLRRWRRRGFAPSIALASGGTESERREAGRAAVAGLVRRIRRPEERP